METSGEMRLNNSIVEVVMAKLTDVESLTEAFDGCRGVFHTAAFVDPAGLSGYSVSPLSFWFSLIYVSRNEVIASTGKLIT